MERHIDINRFDYALPEERIAKFPLAERSASKLLIYRGGEIAERHFADIGDVLPEGELLVFNNTKVIRARIIMHKPSGARIEVFCLEPHDPADYERAFAVKGRCVWSCIVGNRKKWKEGCVEINFERDGHAEYLRAWIEEERGRECTVRFEWSADVTFGQLLELLGRIPIPPYLNRESEEIDNTRYQTVYSKFEGSVAAPTAGLHFTPELIESMRGRGFGFEEVTLHVGAGSDAYRALRGTAWNGGPSAREVGAHHRRGDDLRPDARIAHGAGVAHPAGGYAGRRSGHRAVGALRHSGGLYRT